MGRIIRLFVTVVLAQISAYGQPRIWNLDFPEPQRIFRYELMPEAFVKIRDDLTYAGHLVAGAAEFPWVVDIRGTHYDQLYWATGNLVSSLDVLSTCRAVYQLSFYSRDFSDQAYFRFMENKTIKFEPLIGLKVSFAPNYLWEEDNTPWDPKPVDVDADPFERQRYNSGSRLVERLFVHSDCDLISGKGNLLRYDHGGFRLRHPIYALPPQLSYMPIPWRYDAYRMALYWNPSYNNPEEHVKYRVICYVASIGRSFGEWGRNMLVDYKVKYRVYAEKFQRCVEIDSYYEFDYHHCRVGASSKECNLFLSGPELTCYTTRGKVGAVCGHDRGAPVVCDGRVFGFVTSGVHGKFCNSKIPLPFLVIKLSVMKHLDVKDLVINIDSRYTKSIQKLKRQHSVGTYLSHSKYPFFFIISILKWVV